jgi:hypothetical protein
MIECRAGRIRIERLLDAQALVGHMLPAGSVHAFLAEHRESVFPDGMFADLFPSGRGRPSVPGSVIASVLVLQALQGFSDREAMEALQWELRWKMACCLPVDHEGLHPTTLTLWRGIDPEHVEGVIATVIAQALPAPERSLTAMRPAWMRGGNAARAINGC